MSGTLREILPGLVPGVLLALAYLVLFWHRHDYLGHYAAGLGATLVALAIACERIPDARFGSRFPAAACLVTLLCIAAGAYGEATLFNIARFDEVDFCNQSLGAVLAGAAFLAGARHEKPSPAFFRGELIAGLILLHVGFYFAMF